MWPQQAQWPLLVPEHPCALPPQDLCTCCFLSQVHLLPKLISIVTQDAQVDVTHIAMYVPDVCVNVSLTHLMHIWACEDHGHFRKIKGLLWRDMCVLQVLSVTTGRLGKGAELPFLRFY